MKGETDTPACRILISVRLWVFFFPFTVSCRIVFANQKTLRHGHTNLIPVSCPGSEVHFILQRLLRSFCKLSHWLYGPCMKCSIAFSSFSSQRPAFYSLTHDSHAYRNMELTRECIRFVFDQTDMNVWLQLCKSCSGLCNPWETRWF